MKSNELSSKDLMVGHRWIKEYDGMYSVSSGGRVFSYKSNKYLKLQSNEHYLKVTLTKNGKQIQKLVHRLVAEAFIPNPENKKEVNHIDGNKLNNNIDNLEWVTPKENQQHSVRKNLRKFGTDLWNGKFNKLQVLEIIELKKEGFSCKRLGVMFGCNATTISAISRGLRYKKYFELETATCFEN